MSESAVDTFGRYRLHRRFARGGMAELFLAEQRSTADDDVWKLVVIKRVLPHLADDAHYARMFLDEARIASRFSHPNIVNVLDFGAIDGQHFLAMEYVAGETLRAIIDQCKAQRRWVPLSVVVQILINVLDGLHYAHEYREGDKLLKVIHRDVSPTNMMVTYQGEVKILDFGIARAAGRAQDLTESGVMKGKVAYVAPEQYRGKVIDRRADLFSLGATAFELITCKSLFRRETREATIRALLYDEIVSPSMLRPEVSPELDRILERALARDRDERYRTALEMRRDLEPLMTGPAVRLDEYLGKLFGPQQARARTELRAEISAGRARIPPPPPPSSSSTSETTIPRPRMPTGTLPTQAMERDGSGWLRWVGIAAIAVLVLGLLGGAGWGVSRLLAGGDDRGEQGMALAQRGELERAKALIAAYAEDHPDDADARIAELLVRWWQAAPDIDDQVAACRAVALDEVQLATVESLVLVNEGHFGEALAYLEPFLDEHPDRAALLYVAGEARWHRGDLDDAVDTLLAAYRADPAWLMALHHPVDYMLDDQQWSQLEQLEDEVTFADPIAGAVLRSRRHMGLREYKPAVKAAQDALALDPESTAALIRLTEAHVLAGELTLAEQRAREAFTLWPLDTRGDGTSAHRAELHLYRGELAAFLDGFPNAPSRALVEVLWQGRSDAFREAPDADGLRPPPLHVACYLEAATSRGEPTQAVWSDYPDEDVRWFGDALQAETRGRLDAAENKYRKALEVPQSGQLRMLASHHLARVLVADERPEEAGEVCKEVLHPRNYLPYRAVLLPDCAVWSAVGAQPLYRTLMYEQITEPWTGEFEHPAVREARAQLAGKAEP